VRVGVDRRSREIRPAPEAEKAAEEALRHLRENEATAALALATIEQRRSYVRHGFKTVGAWAESRGYGPSQTSRLLSLGRSMLAEPQLEPLLRSGRACSESVMHVGKVLREPTLELASEERQAWIDKAVTVPPRRLREEADKAIEDARQGAPTKRLSLQVTHGVQKAFARSRHLMSRGQRRLIPEGEVLGRLAGEWLIRNDPRLKPLPHRPARSGKAKRSRYISKQVQALVERRSGGICEVCGQRRARQKFHMRVPYAKGGSNEAENIGDGCWDCHALVDLGVWRFEEFDAKGNPQFAFHPEALVDGPGEVRERPPTYLTRSPEALAFG
jgi:hypothetical protein